MILDSFIRFINDQYTKTHSPDGDNMCYQPVNHHSLVTNAKFTNAVA